MVKGSPLWEQTDLLGLSIPSDPPTHLPDLAAPSLELPAKASPVQREVGPTGEAPLAQEPLDRVPLEQELSEQKTFDEQELLEQVPLAEDCLKEEPPRVRFSPAVSLPGFAKMAARPAPSHLERLLILDTETTALHPDEGDCIEVGGVLFHVPSRSVLSQVSFLLPCQANAAEAINGIAAAVSQLEQPWRQALRCFLVMVAAADGILAHNAAFDRQWFGRGPLPALDKPWICSMDDIPWPPGRQLRPAPSVRDLAIAYGVPVWAAHRALTDCTYLVQVLQRCDDLEILLQAAQEPRRLYRAQLSYSERHQAKAAGFRWNDPVQGAWTKRLSEREVSTLPFPVNPVLSA